MDIIFRLIRLNLTPDYTEGVLLYQGRDFCDTLEDRVRDRNADGDLNDEDEGKIYGETAIPYGTYKLTVTKSPRFKKEMTLVQDVPHFTGIRIHWGRSAKNSEGCILVGRKLPGAELKNTGRTDMITAIVKEHIAKGDNVYLKI